MDTSETKPSLRKSIISNRHRLSSQQRQSAEQDFVRRLAPMIPHTAMLGAYWPFSSELNVCVALHQWWKRGVTVCFPRMDSENRTLSYHVWWPGFALVPHRCGILESLDGPCVRSQLTHVLIPSVGLTPSGARLGSGGGWYDRTLPLMRQATCVGVGFECQLVASLPTDPWDQSCDEVWVACTDA